MKTKLFKIVLGLVLLLSVSLVLFKSDVRRLDFDERGVISQLRYSPQLSSPEQFISYISDKNHPRYHSKLYQINRSLAEKNMIKPLFPLIKVTYKIVSMARNSTYAPIFSWVIFLPIILMPNFFLMLFFSRLMITIGFVISSCLLLFLIIKKLSISNKSIVIVTFCLFCFSLSNTLYASHLSSYSFGVLAHIIVLYLLFIASQNIHHITSLKWYLALIGCFLLNYQVLFLFPIVYFCLFFSHVKLNNKKELFEKGRIFGKSVTIMVLFILPLGVLFDVISFGSGASKQLLFSFEKIGPYWVEIIFYCFGLNFIKAISTFHLVCVVAILSFLLIMGTSYLIISKKKYEQLYGLYALSTIVFFIVLNGFNIISDGYSRHSLILLPLLLLLIMYGLVWVKGKLKRSWFESVAYAASIVIIIYSMMVIPNVKKSFQTNWNEKEIQSIISENKISKIFTDHDYFFPIVHYPSLFREWINQTSYISPFWVDNYDQIKTNRKYRESINVTPLKQGDVILFLSATVPLNETHLAKLKYLYNVDSDIDSWRIEQLKFTEKEVYSVRGNHKSKVNTYITKVTL